MTNRISQNGDSYMIVGFIKMLGGPYYLHIEDDIAIITNKRPNFTDYIELKTESGMFEGIFLDERSITAIYDNDMDIILNKCFEYNENLCRYECNI